MELKDYLMPDEYIVGIIEEKFRCGDDDREYNRIAVTNKRVLLYKESHIRNIFFMKTGRTVVSNLRTLIAVDNFQNKAVVYSYTYMREGKLKFAVDFEIYIFRNWSEFNKILEKEILEEVGIFDLDLEERKHRLHEILGRTLYNSQIKCKLEIQREVDRKKIYPKLAQLLSSIGAKKYPSWELLDKATSIYYKLELLKKRVSNPKT
jgi:hypothetical protein